MKRPDPEKRLAPLRRFQRRTVEHACKRLWDPTGPGRFLVADEVGLGKTRVARGVVAKTVDTLWDQTDRIDIVYVCSNAQIAEQNLRKLHIGNTQQVSLATRLTLLPAQIAGANGPGLDPKLNFFSFTPGTSLSFGQTQGKSDERVLLYWLLEEIWGGGTALKNAMQGGVRDPDHWRNRLQRKRQELAVADEARDRFAESIQSTPRLKELYDEVLHEFRYYHQWKRHARTLRTKLVATLRLKLAEVAIDLLQPDLVILDEFQRFKHLLEGEDPASNLARKLFDYVTPEDYRVRLLLLSATPYRMYSSDADLAEEDHYEDFIATTRFLMDDDERLNEFEGHLRRYRGAVRRAAVGVPEEIKDARNAVEEELRRIMSRTERTGVTRDRQSMVEEIQRHSEVTVSDVEHFVAADEVFRAVGDRDPVEFWKSASYLPNLMRGYRFSDRLRRELRNPAVVGAMRRHADRFLSAEDIHGYRALDPANARLRVLAADVLDSEQWELLWVPPSLPYWEPEGAYGKGDGFTKALVFSAWNVVPDVISAVLSYEAERRMLGDSPHSYQDVQKKHARPLQFRMDGGRAGSMTAVMLQYPCLRLADACHPLELRRLGHADPRRGVRQRVEELVSELPKGEGAADPRWHWAAPILLDGEAGRAAFLEEWPEVHNGAQHTEVGDSKDVETIFQHHLAQVRALLGGELRLGRRPDDLVDVLTDLALAGPAICAARSARSSTDDALTRRIAGARVAEGFRSLFNQATSTGVVRRMFPSLPYWRATLRYGIHGNLQSMLDEYWHQLLVQKGWSDSESDPPVRAIAHEIAHAATLKVSNVLADTFRVTGNEVTSSALRIRTSYALRYGAKITDEDQRLARGEAVRTSFNSPFRPFVLASTSVGQEGLDFHTWCHAVYHWNLPGNPVDLEQREGRVHRYEGHAVRRNVAADHGAAVLRERWEHGEDVWQLLFAEAERHRPDGASDLVPHWIYEGSHKVERRVPLLPCSSDASKLARLKRNLAAYRLVFGQPRQQEMLEMLERTGVDLDAAADWSIDLQPPQAGADSGNGGGVGSP